MSKRSRQNARRRANRQRHHAPGTPPGTLEAVPGAPPPTVTVFAYGAEELTEAVVTDVASLKGCLERWPVTWVNVEGLGDVGIVARIGEIFGLHPLALEDVLSLQQRAKVEEYAGHLFIVARMATGGRPIETEQLSLFVGRNFIVTFQEGRPGDCLDPVRARIRQRRGRIRQTGPDYLAYALLDAVIDGYFPVLESAGEYLEELEDEILDVPSRDTIARIHALKRDLLTLRRSTWPHRDMFNTLIRDPSPLMTDETRIYLRDCYDHTVRIIELIEMYREVGSDQTDLYLSSASSRMNEIMKVLTIITTVFMPLSFIAGVYGMNFNTSKSAWNMPELNWFFGYPFALGLMAAVAGAFWIYFWRKGWLHSFIVRRPRRQSSAAADARGPLEKDD